MPKALELAVRPSAATWTGGGHECSFEGHCQARLCRAQPCGALERLGLHPPGSRYSALALWHPTWVAARWTSAGG